MASTWLEILKQAQKTCLIQDERRKIHFNLPDGRELTEEYDLKTGDLIVRKWRQKKTLGALGQWEFEVGEQLAPRNPDADGLMESLSNPQFVRKDTRKTFQWRIRNLPYPVTNYDVNVDPENRVIIIKTKNKKYYKKYAVPDLDRYKLPLEQSRLSVAHANNTLIITYEKPPEILQMEKLLQDELKKTKGSKDGDVECNPS